MKVAIAIFTFLAMLCVGYVLLEAFKAPTWAYFPTGMIAGFAAAEFARWIAK
jgi:hypothetical protein